MEEKKEEKESLLQEQETVSEAEGQIPENKPNPMERFYENFRGVPLKALDIFIGCCVAALILVVVMGALKARGLL